MAKEKSVLEILNGAIDAKKTTKIIYKGGSQPGTVRKILPLKIEGNKLIADCLSSEKQNQIFEMDKVFYAGGLAQSYNTTLDLPLVKCSICGKKFNGESWRTYCSDCYREKKLAEENDGYEEIESDIEIKNDEGATTRKQILKEAIGTGEAIKVRYYGGSTPGEERELVVRKILKNGYVRCFCLRDNIEKTFFLNKIEIVGMDLDDFVDKGNVNTETEATILHGILAIIIIALFIFTIVCFFRDEWIRFFISIFSLTITFAIFNAIPMKAKSIEPKKVEPIKAATPPEPKEIESIKCPIEVEKINTVKTIELEPTEIKPTKKEKRRIKLNFKNIMLIILLASLIFLILPCLILIVKFLIEGKLGDLIGVTIATAALAFPSWTIIKKLRKK